MYAKRPQDVKWFSSVDTVEKVKALYRELVLKYHPDCGGDTAVTAAVNRQYAASLRNLNGRTFKGTDGKDHTYCYNAARENKVVRIIDRLLAMRMAHGDILLIGVYVWVLGSTRPCSRRLRSLGLRYHDKRRCWYWKPADMSDSCFSGADFGRLAEQYGCQHFTADKADAVQVA